MYIRNKYKESENKNINKKKVERELEWECKKDRYKMREGA